MYKLNHSMLPHFKCALKEKEADIETENIMDIMGYHGISGGNYTLSSSSSLLDCCYLSLF